MKRDYDAPEFDIYKFSIINQLMNPSGTDEELVPGGPDEPVIDE